MSSEKGFVEDDETVATVRNKRGSARYVVEVLFACENEDEES